MKRPFLNLIKVAGLSLALSGILIILLFLKNELSYDSYHKESDRIYRFTNTSPDLFSGKHYSRILNTEYISRMAEYFPEIENYVRLAPVLGGVVKLDNDFLKVNQAFQCDSTFFDVFKSELIVGNPDNVLDDPGSMVVSESFAKKIFGNRNPLGQILTLPEGQYYGENIDFTINGIMKDFPQNSHFHPEFIATPRDKNEFSRSAWTYLLLTDNAQPSTIQLRFRDFYSSNVEKLDEEPTLKAHFQNISDIHLHSDKLREIEANSNMSIVYTLSIAAVLLLFIAIFNYVNLNIGMAAFSDRYLYVSKVFGSSKWLNLKYYLSEAVIVAIASISFSLFITALTHFFIQIQFGLNLLKGNWSLIFLVLVLFSLLTVLSGVLLLLKQGIRNVQSYLDYKNSNKLNRKGVSKGLIVLQYTISISLIVAVLVMQRQTNYSLKSGIGAEASNLICFENVHSNVQSKFDIFKAELLKYNSIKAVSAMLAPPGGEVNDMFQFTMEGYIKNETNKADNTIVVLPCDYSFASIFNLRFLSGGNFSKKNEDNVGSGEYIINESAMKRLNYTDPNDIVGKDFTLIFDHEAVSIPTGKIIGVVKDFHLSSIKKKIEPLVLFKRKNLWLINFVVSFQPGMQEAALSEIESVWKKLFPQHPFEYDYVSSMYKNVYQTELLQAKLLSIFTLIALFISAMGLLGMSLLTTQRRSKEIGIRKVNGAKTSEIMRMLNWDFVKWIMISFVIAIPFAFVAMNIWLENFVYKTTLNWWLFALAGSVAMVIAIFTVSVQSWKAASRNPVEALRYE